MKLDTALNKIVKTHTDDFTVKEDDFEMNLDSCALLDSDGECYE
jgi:hypothetical protein